MCRYGVEDYAGTRPVDRRAGCEEGFAGPFGNENQAVDRSVHPIVDVVALAGPYQVPGADDAEPDAPPPAQHPDAGDCEKVFEMVDMDGRGAVAANDPCQSNDRERIGDTVERQFVTRRTECLGAPCYCFRPGDEHDLSSVVEQPPGEVADELFAAAPAFAGEDMENGPGRIAYRNSPLSSG